MSGRRLLRPAVGLLISGICVVLLLRTVSLDDLGASLRDGNPLVLIPAIALYFVGTLVRSLRWRALLHGQPTSVGMLFRTLVIGLTLNDLLPFRLGEVARVYLLHRSAAVPVGTSLASIVIERVFDGVALTLLLGTGIILAREGGWLLNLAAGSTALFAVATAGLFWASLRPELARRLGYWVSGFAPAHLGATARHLVDGALLGLAPLARASLSGQVVVLSVVAWVLEAMMYVVIMVGFHVPGGIPAGFVGTAAANLASLIPAAPGYAGTFDLALREVLVGIFGATPADATTYTIVVHLTLIVPVVLVGLVFLWREKVSLPELSRHSISRRVPAEANH